MEYFIFYFLIFIYYFYLFILKLKYAGKINQAKLRQLVLEGVDWQECKAIYDKEKMPLNETTMCAEMANKGICYVINVIFH